MSRQRLHAFGTARRIALFLSLLVLTGCSSLPFSDASTGQDSQIVLATTTSTQDSGLLDVLLPMFEDRSGYHIKPISVGTGAALEMGARGEADVVLVHSPEAEREWMAEGNGTDRVLVMYNDFIIVGPAEDPARILGSSTADEALHAVFDSGATWISRDDESGTDKLEKRLWREAGLDPANHSWYVTSGQGMGATLTLANQKSAYTLTDRATYLALRDMAPLTIMVEGDPELLNIYHVMPVNPAKFPDIPINYQGAQAFVEFLVNDATQEVIGEYGMETYGQALFEPAAGITEEQLGQ